TDFVRRFANVHAALKAIFEGPFAASASMNLCLHNNIDIAQLMRDLLRFIERRRDSPARCSHIEFLQQLFGLIFVNIHWVTTKPGRSKVEYSAQRESATIFLFRIGLRCRN